MKSKNSRDFRGLFPISLLETLAKLPMPPRPLSRRQPLIQNLLVEAVQESIAPGDNSVRPLGGAGGPEHEAFARQRLANPLGVTNIIAPGIGESGRGKFRARDACCFKQPLLISA